MILVLNKSLLKILFEEFDAVEFVEFVWLGIAKVMLGGYSMGAINTDFGKLDYAATSSCLTKSLATTMIIMRATGQTNSQMDAPIVLFQTIQFFFINAKKWRVFWPIILFSLKLCCLCLLILLNR